MHDARPQLAPSTHAAALVKMRSIRVGDLLALGLLCLAATALIALGLLRAPVQRVDLAAPFPQAPIFLSGFNGAERDAADTVYRWTEGLALVQLPFAYHQAPQYRAVLRLQGDASRAGTPLMLSADGRALTTLTQHAELRHYDVLLPPAAPGISELRLNIATETFSPPGDQRKLGVIVSTIELKPLPTTNWRTLVALAVGLLGLALLARYRSVRKHSDVPAGSHASAFANVRISLDGAEYIIFLGLALAAFAWMYPGTALSYPTLTLCAMLGSACAMLLSNTSTVRLTLVVLCLLMAFSGALWPTWLSDDAFISFRYAQNLAQGHGLVYNLGERVEGYTNFLWTMLAATVLALGGEIVFYTYLAGVLIGMALLLVTFSVGQRLCNNVCGLLAALVVATSQSVLLYTARGGGLETGFFALLTLTACYCFLVARSPHAFALSGALFALTALTRPEGLLLFGLTLGYLLLPLYQRDTAALPHEGPGVRAIANTVLLHRKLRSAHAVVFALAFALIFVPYFGWRFSFYGDLLPNTFYAKTGGGISQVMRGITYAAGFALTLGGPLLLLIAVPWLRSWRATHAQVAQYLNLRTTGATPPAATICTLQSINSQSALGTWRSYLLLIVLVYSAYIVAVGGDHFRGERFFVPLIPLVALLLADGLLHLLDWLRTLPSARRPHARLAITGLLAIALTGGSLAALMRTNDDGITFRGLDESVVIWRDLGWWMADNAAPGESIAAAGAGAIAYYGQATTIDLYGLTDKHIARVAVEDMGSGVAGHEKRDPDYVLNTRRVTYIPAIWQDYFGGPAVLARDYERLTIVTRSGRQMDMWVRRET
jgi:hypothetical protein